MMAKVSYKKMNLMVRSEPNMTSSLKKSMVSVMSHSMNLDHSRESGVRKTEVS